MHSVRLSTRVSRSSLFKPPKLQELDDNILHDVGEVSLNFATQADSLINIGHIVLPYHSPCTQFGYREVKSVVVTWASPTTREGGHVCLTVSGALKAGRRG